ncbi:hypothetical protein PG987_000102 [Apiospora arundinis]
MPWPQEPVLGLSPISHPGCWEAVPNDINRLYYFAPSCCQKRERPTRTASITHALFSMSLYLPGAPNYDGDTADYTDYLTWLPNPESNNVTLEPPPNMNVATTRVGRLAILLRPPPSPPLAESTILPDPVTHPFSSEGVCSTSLPEETVDPSLWCSELPALDKFAQQTCGSLSNLYGCAPNPRTSVSSLALPNGDEMGKDADGEEKPTALEDRPISVTMYSSDNDTGGAGTDNETNTGTGSGDGGGNGGVHDANGHHRPRPQPHTRVTATCTTAGGGTMTLLPPPRLPRRQNGYVKPIKAQVIGEAAVYIRTLEGDRAALQAEMGNVLFLLSAYRKVLRMKGGEGNDTARDWRKIEK